MKKAKIGIVGHFGIGKGFTDGQTVKTKNLYNELLKIYGASSLEIVDTYNWSKKPFSLFKKCYSIIKNVDNVIILPARRGIKIFLPLFVFLNKKFKKRVYYAVVGGWLPEFLNNNRKLIKKCQQLNMIFVETIGMKEKLGSLNIDNVDVLVNFKDLKILNEQKLINTNELPLKVCTFSRVIKEKGVENAVNAVKCINDKYNKTIYQLDIYGPIGDEYKEEFGKIIKNSPDYVDYKGIIESSKSVEVMKQYNSLLFPTYYDGEGLAGTIIDAFSSGVPVVASDWRYNKEVVTDKETGFIFETKNDQQLVAILDNIYNQKYDLLQIRKNCLKEAKKYLPSVAIKNLTKYINKK